MFDILLSLLGGLILFLFALSNLSHVLKQILGESAQKWIIRFTDKTWSAVATGIVTTILLESSSAVIIIGIVFINAHLLNLKQAMGIILGANIGTTASSQLMAINIAKFSPILLLVGFLVISIAKSRTKIHWGQAIVYFGLLFFGLYTMENAIEPLKSNNVFMHWLKHTENPISGAIMGAAITLIIQSSSATVGMALILIKKGLLTLTGGIAIMLGAELGTCSDTLLATVNGNRTAVKAGLFHLIFNLFSITLGLIFFHPFVRFIQHISGNSAIEQKLATAHIVFNLSGVLIFVWFLPLFLRILNRAIPDKNTI